MAAWYPEMYSSVVQGVDYVAIDGRSQRLLTYAYSPAQLRRISVPLAAIKTCSAMALTTDLRDACIYILSRSVIDRIKNSKESSIKVCCHPVFTAFHTAYGRCVSAIQHDHPFDPNSTVPTFAVSCTMFDSLLIE
jgi:hypothetical protein